MSRSIFRTAILPLAGIALAACASDAPVSPDLDLAGPALTVSGNMGLNAVTNAASVGTGDNAVIGVGPSRPNAIQVRFANNSQWCRSNGAGDDPGAGSIRAIYQDANDKPAAVAYKGTALKVYSRIAGVDHPFVCQNLNAKVGGDDLPLGSFVLPATALGGGGTAAVYVVQNETNGRVEFRRGSTTGLIIGRTNGAGDDGKLIAGWKGSDGQPYALIGKGNDTNGRYLVVTPTFVNVGIFPVATVGRVDH
jgi:hypothetical protein